MPTLRASTHPTRSDKFKNARYQRSMSDVFRSTCDLRHADGAPGELPSWFSFLRRLEEQRQQPMDQSGQAPALFRSTSPSTRQWAQRSG